MSFSVGPPADPDDAAQTAPVVRRFEQHGCVAMNASPSAIIINTHSNATVQRFGGDILSCPVVFLQFTLSLGISVSICA